MNKVKLQYLWMKEPIARGGGLSISIVQTVVPVQVFLVLITGVARESYATCATLLPNVKQLDESTILPTVNNITLRTC